MYPVKQSDQFTMELTTVCKCLKRQIAKEKQIGNGKIQSGKTPILFLPIVALMNIFKRKYNGINIISPSHPLLIASFATSAHAEQLQKKVSVLYAYGKKTL